MERIPTSAHTELVQLTMESLPSGVRRLLHGVHFVIDVDPVWIGLTTNPLMHDGRLACQTSHVSWKACHQEHLAVDQRETTVVLLNDGARSREMILHELGHALDERLMWERPGIWPMDDYAATNGYEAFATAFQSWATPRGPDLTYFHNRDRLLAADPDACAFFEMLAKLPVT